VPDKVPDGGQLGCQTRYPTGARRGVRRGPDEGPNEGLDGARRREPDGARRSARRGPDRGQDGGPNGVPDGSHVIGHIIFECHAIRLGWQGVILLPTLLNQR
jgi:hypothetical protein